MQNESANPSAGAEETVFNTALHSGYLTRVCGDNLSLRQRVEALLRAREAAQLLHASQALAHLLGVMI